MTGYNILIIINKCPAYLTPCEAYLDNIAKIRRLGKKNQANDN